MSINISGLDKAKLLEELWNSSAPASYYSATFQTAPGFNSHLAADISHKGYIDYFCGRCIKSDLSRDEVSPFLYDRDAGPGAFQRCVDKVKNLV